MTVKLGNDDRTDAYGLLERLSLSKTRLTDATIHDEDACVRRDLFLDLHHFVEKGLFLSMSTRCVHDDDLVIVLAEIGHASLSNFHWVSLLLITVEGTLNLGCIHLELREGAGTEGIRAYNANFPSFLHIVVCELCASGRLTGTL